MSDIRSIYFYGNNKSIKLGKNPILNTVFEIFPATKTPLKRILNHNHQWVSNCAFYVPNDVKSEWVKTVTLSILTISIMASFRNAIAQQKGLSPNDEALDEEVENLVPDSLFNSAIELSDLKKSLLEVLPNLMSEYLAQNFGEYESIITNGVAKLFIDNHEFLDKQLDSDAGTDNQISMLNFTDNADELFHTTNYILVRIADSNENLKINFTNSKPHAEHLGRILHTLLGDESFEISKGSIEIPNDEDGQEIFIFEKETNFIDFYNSVFVRITRQPSHLAVITLSLVIVVTIFLKGVFYQGHGTAFKGGFVSGHTSLAFCLATIGIMQSQEVLVKLLFLLLALIIAESRYEADIHSIPEIIRGAILGTSMAMAIFGIFS